MRPTRSSALHAVAACAIALALAATAPAQTTVTGTLLSDRWQYPFQDPGTLGSKDIAHLFAYTPTAPPFFSFNARDGMAILQWELELPAQFVGQNYRIASARIEYYDSKESLWTTGSLNVFGQPEQVEVYAAGFTSYDESTWTGTEPYVGGTLAVPGERDPFPRDLLTNTRVEDNLTTATPWAVWSVPTTYAPGSKADAVLITCTFDTDIPAIQQELKAGLESGRSTWFLTSTFGFGDVPSDFNVAPQVITLEGLGNTDYGTSQQAAALILEIEAAASVRAWQLYE